jgi:hypothetical protein
MADKSSEFVYDHTPAVVVVLAPHICQLEGAIGDLEDLLFEFLLCVVEVVVH